MNRKIRTIAVAVLLLGVASLVGGCKKCECGNGNGSVDNDYTIYSANNNCVKFTDKITSSEHKMQLKLYCVSENDTSRLELDGTCLKEFIGVDEVQVTKIVEKGRHRIQCYTFGTTDTVVNVTFEQNQDGVINWTSNIHQ